MTSLSERLPVAFSALSPQPLTIEGFEPFGQVIEPDAAREIRLINNGTTTRFHAVADVDTGSEDGRPIISIFRGKPFAFPISIAMMERHPLGSQAFIPLHALPYLAVVAPDEEGRPGSPVAFWVEDGRGVGYARHTWHHPLIALGEVCDFLVVDREGGGRNLEEVDYPAPFRIAGPPGRRS